MKKTYFLENFNEDTFKHFVNNSFYYFSNFKFNIKKEETNDSYYLDIVLNTLTVTIDEFKHKITLPDIEKLLDEHSLVFVSFSEDNKIMLSHPVKNKLSREIINERLELILFKLKDLDIYGIIPNPRLHYLNEKKFCINDIQIIPTDYFTDLRLKNIIFPSISESTLKIDNSIFLQHKTLDFNFSYLDKKKLIKLFPLVKKDVKKYFNFNLLNLKVEHETPEVLSYSLINKEKPAFLEINYEAFFPFYFLLGKNDKLISQFSIQSFYDE